MKHEDLRVGMIVQINKPRRKEDEYIYWNTLSMDKYDGEIVEVSFIDPEDTIFHEGFYFSAGWLTLEEGFLPNIPTNYQDKLLAIQTASGMMEQELAESQPNEVKLKEILAQIRCISEGNN